ncbi:MAG: protein kinase [Gemmatimonadaceae bacterium]
MSDIATLTAALASHYTIIRELGEGGMATVYLARDVKHEREVAIKVLKPEIAAAVGAQRFLREIKTTANLRHPHIVPLYDSGEVNLNAPAAGDGPQQLLYYVMPLVDGESLRNKLDREKQLPIDEALRITREVAEALSYAHMRGVIHRDVKPENIMIENGHAVVADFGIARAVDAAGGDRLTQTGLSIGTPLYMSPEQAAADPDLDGRSDEYSLACVCFEMLGGQPPFTGPTAMAVTRQHLIADAPPISNLRAAVSPGVVSALRRALAKAPVDRFATLEQFASAISPLTASGEIVAATSQPVATSESTPASSTDSTTGSISKPTSRPTSASTATSSTLTSSADSTASIAYPARSKSGIFVGIAALLMAVVAFAIWKRGTPPANANEASVAVLPFTDMSADHNSAFLGDGVAETLINALASVPGLFVAARGSAFSFRDKSADLKSLGALLHVATVLEGSVQRAGEKLRITARVVRISDDSLLWHDTFDRSAADIFAVQDEVAREVVSALRLKLANHSSSVNATTGTQNPKAYDAYMLGRYHWNRRTTDGMIQATAAFKNAIALDSSYAQAWSGLADSYVLSIPEEYNVPNINRDSTLLHAEQSARRAIELAPQLGEAQASLGEILEYRRNWVDAVAAFQRGIQLSPNYATGHQWYGYSLVSRNLWDAGIREMSKAHELDPASHVITLSLAIFYDGADRFDEATPLYEQGFKQSPEAWYAWEGFIGHELAGGRLESALSAMRKDLVGSGKDSAKVSRWERGLRDTTTLRATVYAMAKDGCIGAAISFARFKLSDKDALAVFDSLSRVPGLQSNNLGFYITLGPKLRADPLMQVVIDRLRWPPLGAMKGEQ